MSRENEQARALLSHITSPSGLMLRPISLGTLTILQLLGNPLATYLDTEHRSAEEAAANLRELLHDRQTLTEVWYVHSAPLPQFVPDLVRGDVASVRAAALEWALDKPAHAPAEVIDTLLQEHLRVLSTMWQVVPEKGGRSKNEPSPF